MSGPDRIDTHHHIVPPAYRQWLADKGVMAGGLPIPEWTADGSLEFMDANGIRTAILSVSTPGAEPGEPDEARAVAREVNEYASGVVVDHPGRFGFFATVPLPDVDGALEEVRYAFDELGADGVVLLANCKGTYLGDASFDPLMDELNRRGAVVFVHPSALPADPVPGIPPFAADFLLDTSRAALNLTRSGTMDRYGNLKVILSHAGGFVPYASARMSTIASPTGLPSSGLDALRRFYFDTALSSSPYALPSLLAFAEPGHVLFGSDYPYAPAPLGTMFAASLDAYDDVDHVAVNRDNATALFPRLS